MPTATSVGLPSTARNSLLHRVQWSYGMSTAHCAVWARVGTRGLPGLNERFASSKAVPAGTAGVNHATSSGNGAGLSKSGF